MLLLGLFGVLLFFGGASQAIVPAQAVVRGTAWLVVIVAILFGRRPTLGRAKPIMLFLVAAASLALLQLLPLPPSVWQALPGREALREAAAMTGQAQPWRPWSIAPGGTTNALGSLIVPFATLLLVLGLEERERSLLPSLVLAMVAASTLIGLLQFSGGAFDYPLINDAPGEVSGTFANRNHFALLLAIGCLLAPIWAFSHGRRPGWRGSAALGLILLFVLTLLATGSRAGIVLGLVALVAGLMLVRGEIGRRLTRYPRWVIPAAAAGIVGLLAAAVLISVAADRAVSIDRALAIDTGNDLRSRGLPTVLAMIREYFPFGSGFGSFDPVFRMHEPFDLLKPTYFNHAHNDALEVILEAGLPGALLLLAGLFWVGRSSLYAWRGADGPGRSLARLGASVLLLIIVASVFDYPARTPLIMAIAVVAAIWLSGAATRAARPALPTGEHHL